MPNKRDLYAARLRRQGVKEEDIEKLRADKQEAERLALLMATAKSRGAAPLPPGLGGPPPAERKKSSGPPAKVAKYRAIKDYEGDVSFEKGATVFVVGEADADGMVQGVVSGKSGSMPMSALGEITPELLEAERVQREKDLEQARLEEEEEMRKEMEQMKIDHAAQAAAKEDTKSDKKKKTKGGKSAELIAYEKKLDEEFQAERQKLLDEETRLKAEAARIEKMLAEMDD